MSEPERLRDLLLAVMCGAVDEMTGDLCRVIGPHEQHAYDGEDAWRAPSNTPDDTSRRTA